MTITANHNLSDPSHQILQDTGSGLITDLPTFEVELDFGVLMIMSFSITRNHKMAVVTEQWKIEMFS